ncbi:ligase-associated DNA damage response endonuclease PdeM [Rhodohalobacter sp. SW132]|uniref:ligase-associated DNA damage response endonuclease PdeM n=1 Tax=Rhodohalobacter sp. SW132 TaxID=2293433 RepID=UPI000E2281DC|nr:ligase-associated DNA damage response endonuclease PdeM [Rhodohalobacter sp. SW132]REL24982.1 ligase-associated DNA damage response endonuclease PdeM [Rhodohalobacter sp. SW132]
MSKLEIEINGHEFQLLPERALFWPSRQTLIIADLHLGKSGHFRKHGIAAPQQINEKNLARLDKLISRVKPKRVFILGDLFHSSANREWLRLENWLTDHANLDFHLITGNHDILHASFYKKAGLTTHATYFEGGFRFVHDIEDVEADDSHFTFSGHIHPGVRLKGAGRQSIRLPCYYQKKHHLILPAFGEFTGLFLLAMKDAEQIYAIAESSVCSIKKYNY